MEDGPPQDGPTRAGMISFGCAAALVVCLMLISMLNATFMLVAILRYDTVRREVPFHKFWSVHCESDWKFALRAFVFGIPIFCLVLALIGWVKLWKFGDGSSWIWTSSCISSIAISTILLYLLHTERKWREWLLISDMKLKLEV